MKHRLILFILFPLNIMGQTESTNPGILREKVLEIDVETRAPVSLQLPFASIKIIDSRFDTTKIGYVYEPTVLLGKSKQYKRLKLTDGVANGMEKYFNNYYKSSFASNGFELLLVLKKMWFSNLSVKSIKNIRNNKNFERKNNFLLKCEYYIVYKDSYLPVKRCDTIFDISEHIELWSSTSVVKKYQKACKYFFNKIIEMYDFGAGISKFEISQKKNLSEIHVYNAKRLNLPILKDSLPKNGVFLNFEQFRSNIPSINLFKEKTVRYGITNKEDYLEDANGNTINSFWAYASKDYLKYGRYGHEKMYRCENTFDFYMKFNEVSTDVMNDLSNKTPVKSSVETWVPVQLDMETGEIY